MSRGLGINRSSLAGIFLKDMTASSMRRIQSLTRSDSTRRETLAPWDTEVCHPRYVVGVINHHTYDDLERCLGSVKSQSITPAGVFVFDGDSDPARLDKIHLAYPEVIFEPGPNRGYAGGANAILHSVDKLCPDVQFVLILTPDVMLGNSFAAEVLAAMDRFPEAALASGKLMRPDGHTIDSAGVVLPRNRRPRDRGSEEIDRGQYENTELMFGVSGAALMLRRSILPDLALDGEVFDEDFFVYHEDTDVAWRANRLGWRALYVPSAQAIHRRRWRREQRFKIDLVVRRHSFKNHYLQMIKNERGRDFLMNVPVFVSWELARLGFALLADRGILAAYADARHLSRRAWRKRQILQAKLRERHPGDRRRATIAGAVPRLEGRG
jgi:GT2 family glycosyltransferase